MGRKDIFEVIIDEDGEIVSTQFENYKDMVTWAKGYGILLTPMGVRWATIKGQKYQIKQYRGD